MKVCLDKLAQSVKFVVILQIYLVNAKFVNNTLSTTPITTDENIAIHLNVSTTSHINSSKIIESLNSNTSSKESLNVSTSEANYETVYSIDTITTEGMVTSEKPEHSANIETISNKTIVLANETINSNKSLISDNISDKQTEISPISDSTVKQFSDGFSPTTFTDENHATNVQVNNTAKNREASGKSNNDITSVDIQLQSVVTTATTKSISAVDTNTASHKNDSNISHDVQSTTVNVSKETLSVNKDEITTSRYNSMGGISQSGSKTVGITGNAIHNSSLAPTTYVASSEAYRDSTDTTETGLETTGHSFSKNNTQHMEPAIHSDEITTSKFESINGTFLSNTIKNGTNTKDATSSGISSMVPFVNESNTSEGNKYPGPTNQTAELNDTESYSDSPSLKADKHTSAKILITNEATKTTIMPINGTFSHQAERNISINTTTVSSIKHETDSGIKDLLTSASVSVARILHNSTEHDTTVSGSSSEFVDATTKLVSQAPDSTIDSGLKKTTESSSNNPSVNTNIPIGRYDTTQNPVMFHDTTEKQKSTVYTDSKTPNVGITTSSTTSVESSHSKVVDITDTILINKTESTSDIPQLTSTETVVSHGQKTSDTFISKIVSSKSPFLPSVEETEIPITETTTQSYSTIKSSGKTNGRIDYTEIVTSPLKIHAQKIDDGDDTYWPVAVALSVGVPVIIVFGVTIVVLHRKRKLEKAHNVALQGYFPTSQDYYV